MKSAALKRTAKRRLVIAALLLAPTLSACGFGAQTDQQYQAATGTNYRTGDVWILNAVVVSSTDGSGTFAGTLVNKTAEPAELTAVSGDGVKAQLAAGEPIRLGAYPNGSDNLGEAGETVPPAKLTLSGAADVIAPGQYVTLTFTFGSGSTATMKVPVYPVTEDYTDVPMPAPSPTATKSPKAPKTPETPVSSPTTSPTAG